MKVPLQEKGPQTFVDEQQRHTEFSRHEELHTSRELYESSELLRGEELQEPKRQAPSNRKKKTQEAQVKLLSQYVAGIATVAVTTVVAVAAVPSAPKFKLSGEDIGLHSFRCALSVTNGKALPLNAYLTEESGEPVAQMAIGENGELIFEDLLPETEYVVRVRDEQEKEYFTYSFTTDPFVTFAEVEEGGAKRMILHEYFDGMNDITFELYDSEGKEFRGNAYGVILNEDEFTDSSYDSATDEPPQWEIEYYLSLEGLYTDEYTLRFLDYRGEEDRLYETKLQLGDLNKLSYTPTVDSAAGQISLQYLSGDIGPHQSLTVELHRGEEYWNVEATLDSNGNVVVPLEGTWEAGSYTIYLVGHYQEGENYMDNQIWKGEIVME